MRLFFVILFQLYGVYTIAQPSPGSITLSVNEGLSQGMVFDMIQSRDGYLWIATKDGLNRYDGYRFKIFSPDPYDPFSIGASETWGLFEDSKGRIWVFYNGGIDVLIPETGRFYHVPKKLLPGFGFSPGYIACRMAESSDGSIWVMENDRLWSIRVPGDMFSRADKEDNANPDFEVTRIIAKGADGTPEKFTSVYSSGGKNLMVGTFNGLQLLDVSTKKLTSVALPGRQVCILGKDNRGHFFLSGPINGPEAVRLGSSAKDINGQPKWAVWTMEPGKSQPYFITPSIESFKFDHAGNLWTFEKNSLGKWKPETFISGGSPDFEWATSEAVASSPYFDFGAICVDRSGIVWVGTNGYGLRKVVPQQTKFSSYLPLISQRRIFEDPAGLLICAEMPDIAFNTKTFSSQLTNPWYRDPSTQNQGVFLFDKNGNAWISNQEDILTHEDKVTGAVRIFPWKAYGLIMNEKQVIFGVDTAGLRAFDTKTLQSRLYRFAEPQRLLASFWHLHYLYEGANGIIWIFGFEGLIKATPSAGGFSFTYYRNDPKDLSSLSNDFVCSVADDPLNPGTYLWVGTKGGGLNRLDIKTGKFIHYQTKDGLPDNVVYGILAESSPPAQKNKGRLWLSTNKGLSRFDIDGGRFKNFTATDGLQNNEFNLGSYLKTRDGFMVFGGVNGLTVFHPDSLLFNPAMPQTRIVSIEVNNQPVETDGETGLRLGYTQNFLNITFSALEFTNPGQNQYRYQLSKSGFFGNNKEEKWIELGGKNSVSLAGLSPGSYTFRVMGSNNDGLWNDTPAVVGFVIRPPWWAAWWAFFVYLIVAAGAVFLFYKNRLKQRLEVQETRRLRELDEFKNRFFTNISHEFRTPLTVIMGTAGQLDNPEESQRVKEKAGLIKRSSQNLLRLINQLLDLAKLETSTLTLNYVQGDVLPYLRYIAESLHSLANAQNVMLKVDSPEKQIVMDYDPERLMQIVYNLLSNAIKFTPSGGKVVLNAALVSDSFHLTVADNGAGIPTADLPHIFDRFYQAKNLEKAKTGGTGIGLALTRELVQLLGGHISVQSEWGRGTTFSITLPVHRKALVEASPVFAAEKERVVKTVRAPGENNPDLPALLMIEDNPDVVDFLTAGLEPFYNLEYAYNGRSGIEKALEIIPDLIISDVMMPEKDGFEVCQALKEDPRTSHIPIVLLTAKAGVENRITGLRRGADAYLAKPFHQEELLVTLTNLLDLRRKLQARYAGDLENEMSAVDLVPVAEMDKEHTFLQQIRAVVEANLSDENFESPQLERALGMSRSQIFRKVKALTGNPPTYFVRSIRLHKGRELLKTTDKTVSEIAYEVGFSSVKYFSDSFLKEFGIRPTEVRE